MKKIASGFWRAIPRRVRRVIVRLTQTSFTVSASAIVFDSAGQILLLNHVLRPAASGWDIIGGYLSANEQPEAALRRELREEADITVKDLRLLELYTTAHHVEIVYRAEIESGEARANSREIIEARWFAPDELPPELGATQRRLINLARGIGENN